MSETDDALTTEVPIWPALVAPVLDVLGDGTTYHRKDLFDLAAGRANLSETARNERLSTGGLRYEQRMGWVLSHAVKAGWATRPARAHYAITPLGLEWRAKLPSEFGYTDARALFAEYWPQSSTSHSETSAISAEDRNAIDALEPVEQIEDGIARIRADIGAQLLERLRDSHPDFFERAVLSLLLAMGYGGTEKRGRQIGGTNDGGVDGVIDQDALGLDRIYVQAKRYKEGNNISRETIQAFVGALHGVGASKGVFISTSDFTSNAREYARNVPSQLILIDGQRLVNLMIDYKVGVQRISSYDVVDIDEDFFE
jgi:restriction system protein